LYNHGIKKFNRLYGKTPAPTPESGPVQYRQMVLDQLP
jgi:hypothetical protein